MIAHPSSRAPGHAMHTLRRRLSVVAIAALLPLLLLAAAPAFAEKRVALVIGNSAYVNIPRLANPANDAKLMADTLRALGFTLVGGKEQLDLDKAGIDRAVQAFGAQLQGADVGLFYYAGHGVQVRGANYLVPVGANPVKEADVDFQMLDTNLVLRQMEGAGARLNLVILDACRNNPFGGRGLRSSASGLAQMQAPKGTLISFATQPGNTALDGEGGNSPYTKALAQTIRKPGLGIFDAFNEVGLVVERATGGVQQPWVSSSPIAGSFYFAGTPAASPAPVPATAGPAPDETMWNFVKDTKDPDQLRRFIEQFPASARRNEAAARLFALEQAKVAVVAPPVAPATPPAAAPQPAVGVFPSGVTPLSPERERALKPKDSFKECNECPDMVVVPAGSFMMGSPESEPQRDGSEPQRRVTFARQFAVGRFAVTFDEWNACVTDGGCNGYKPTDEGWGRGKRPAINISWNDAKAYTAWLSRKIGRTYRLLSEAEREYVTRAGTTTPFWWGSTISTSQANYNGEFVYGSGSKGENRGKTLPVDSFQPNPWGLYQVHGNVWEWTEDCWNSSYAGAPTDGAAWTSSACPYRVSRGGMWDHWPWALRSAARSWSSPDSRGNGKGFRVARTLDQVAAAVAPPVAPATPPAAAPQPAVGVFPAAPAAKPLSPAQERALKPKASFKECDACPEMVVIPAGSFTMGNPGSEPMSDFETPQLRVRFARPFAIGRFAVTFDEWDACVADGGCISRNDEGWGRGKRPVINVSWDLAKAYVAWLSRKTGKTYRLPSEAEREYAARAGTTTPFWWGSSISTSQANYDGNHVYGSGSKGEFRQKTVPVDSFRPNPWGLYQVHGNVVEWMEDCWLDHYAGVPTDGSAKTSGACTRRVQRGGHWKANPLWLRSAARSSSEASLGLSTFGFRVARTLTP